MATDINPEQVTITEVVEGHPVHLMSVETSDGLYAPIGVRKPDGEDPFPMVLLASGNDGGRRLRDRRPGREMFNRSPLEYEDA